MLEPTESEIFITQQYLKGQKSSILKQLQSSFFDSKYKFQNTLLQAVNHQHKLLYSSAEGSMSTCHFQSLKIYQILSSIQ